jgi:small subunit ribosomal protein S20
MNVGVPSQALHCDPIMTQEVIEELPNIKSAKKRVKVIAVKTLRNKMYKSALKTQIKKFNTAIDTLDKAAAEAVYKDTIKKIDQAVSRGIMHKNAAARHKSRYTKKLNAKV